MARWGQPQEALWPYDPSRTDTDATYQPPAEALDASSYFEARMSQIPTDADTIKSHLLANQGVMLGIQISLTFMSAHDGYIKLPAADELVDEGHAVLIVGYEEAENDTGAWLIRNSWGMNWGLGGYGYLPYQYVEQYGREAWVIASVGDGTSEVGLKQETSTPDRSDQQTYRSD